MNDMTQREKDQAFESANSREIFIRDRGGEKHPARLYGRLLSFPFIEAKGNPQIGAMVSWSLVFRLADGRINTVTI